jgi:nitrate reductase NapE component
MPDGDSLSAMNKPKGWVVVVLSLGLAAVMTVAGFGVIAWMFGAAVGNEARAFARTVAEEFRETFQFTPEVRVDSTIVVAQETPVLQFVVLERENIVRHRWTHTWLHSTKEFEIEAVFTARTGFDLEEPFRIQIDRRTRAVGALLPKPQILSVGMNNVRVLRDEDGLWNKLTAADREEAFAELERVARLEFSQSNLLHDTRRVGEKRVQEFLDSIAGLPPPPSPVP